MALKAIPIFTGKRARYILLANPQITVETLFHNDSYIDTCDIRDKFNHQTLIFWFGDKKVEVKIEVVTTKVETVPK